MRFTSKMLSAAVAIAATATVAQAQFTFTGTTTGCFYGSSFGGTTSCTPTAASTLSLGTGGSLVFAGSTLSQLALDGSSSFNTALDNFGQFTLTSPTAGAASTAGNFFTLMFNITNPGSATGMTMATLTGSVTTTATNINIDFSNNNFFTLTPASAGIQAQVNDLSISQGANNFINGRLAASVVPEPSTYALMGTGLAGLLGIASRRRRVAA